MALIKCTECGKKLSDKAVACPNCGCPTEMILADIKEIEGKKNISKISQIAKYTYLGYELYIKESVDIYLNMCKELKKVGEDVRKKLSSTILYNGENHFETLVGIVLSSISEGVSCVVNSLNLLGGNITEEEFVINEAECFSIIISVLEKYEENYYDIVKDIAGMEAYRNIRQAIRGRFVGGGQGIDGMIKGALTAEVANLAIGAGYTVANFIGNIGTRLKVEKKTQNLTKRILDLILEEKYIEITLKNIELVFLQKYSHSEQGVCLQEYDANHAEYNVIPDRLEIVDKEQKRQAYFSILESIPYCPVIYKILLMEYGDSENELQVLAIDYGIDIDRIKREVANLTRNDQQY